MNRQLFEQMPINETAISCTIHGTVSGCASTANALIILLYDGYKKMSRAISANAIRYVINAMQSDM